MTSDNQETWHGIPREQIHWSPTVVADRCVACGLCVASCGRGVYAFDYEQGKPVVQSAQRCMVGCTTCATICLFDAIEFPSRGYIRTLIRRERVLSRTKHQLGEQRTTNGARKARLPQPILES